MNDKQLQQLIHSTEYKVLLHAEKSSPQAVGESESTESFPQAVGGLQGTFIFLFPCSSVGMRILSPLGAE